MNKKITIGCILAILMLLAISLTPAIGTNTTKPILATAPLGIGGEEAINETISDAGGSIIRGFSNGFATIDSETLDGMMKKPSFLLDGAPEFAPGEFIIKFREDVDICPSLSSHGFLVTGIASVDILNRVYSVPSAEKIFKDNPVPSLSNVYKFTLADDADILSIVEEYSRNPDVVYVEPNYVYTIQKAQAISQGVFPNDSAFTEQWALHNTGQDGGTPDADIDAPEAWDIETGSPDVVIAVIDTGVYYYHDDLADNIWYDYQGNPGYDFVNNDTDPLDEINGHGTHCAGIASAVTNNGIGVAGVCWNCSIMPVKSLNDEGLGYSDDLAKGIYYAADNGADVISMSWGGYSRSYLISDALDHAYSKGVVLVASAGNDYWHIKSFPAGHDNVIAVAATDRNDEKPDFSNYGYWVDVAAPGVNIYSTFYRVIWNDKPYILFYYEMSGTSMSCPHVAGLAALLLSKNECTNQPGMAKTLIVNTADPISSDKYIGRGRINAYQALLREPAIAILDVLADWTDVKGIVDINGWAWSEVFEYYTIAYGRGGEPDSWTEIKYSNSYVQDDVLAVLDTTELDEGLYTIKLTVVCSDGVYTDKTRIVVNNEQNTIHVDDDNTGGPWDGTPENPFIYVRDGVDDAGKYDIVYVHSGTYYEPQLFIEKTINLTGEDQDSTIIDGDGRSNVVFIIADNVGINGFTIKHSGVGIWTSSSCNTSVTGNIIIDNYYYGIYLLRSTHNIISGNTITNNDEYGIRLSHSSHNIISENSIIHNTEGIAIALNSSSYNNVYGNNITDNENGISITKEDSANPDSIKNNIYQNNITNNNGIGISIFGDCSGMNDNNIYHNNFIDNDQNNAYDKCDNTWYNTDLKQGNYWDDHKGFDPDGDGIANNPYKIPDGDINPFNNNKDMYPLMGPYPDPIPYNNNQASQSNQRNIHQQSSNPLLLRILERFLELFPLLRQLMGL